MVSDVCKKCGGAGRYLTWRARPGSPFPANQLHRCDCGAIPLEGGLGAMTTTQYLCTITAERDALRERVADLERRLADLTRMVVAAEVEGET